MIDYQALRGMYQQWCAGNPEYATRWVIFARMASKCQGMDFQTMKQELKKCKWFSYRD